jgi:lysophospholipase L1-like esterase
MRKLLLALLLAVVCSVGLAQPWDEQFAAFAAADKVKPPQPGGILFVGSSSIRLWEGMEGQFDMPLLIKRGFGGSQLSDVVTHVELLVLRYAPKVVVLYAGDNDLAAGRSPQYIRDQFIAFEKAVHQALPETRIAFVSIKPSPARRIYLEDARAANGLIETHTKGKKNLEYIDIFTPMLDKNGLPRPELFRADALHLNEAGYDLWVSIIRPRLLR